MILCWQVYVEYDFFIIDVLLFCEDCLYIFVVRDEVNFFVVLLEYEYGVFGYVFVYMIYE